jgi:hypothetical protein
MLAKVGSVQRILLGGIYLQPQIQRTASKHVRIEEGATAAADDVNAMKASKDLHAKGFLAREMHRESLATVLEHANLCCA